MIAQALKYNGPALVEVLVSRQELSKPPTITYEQAKGFSLFMMKAVLYGHEIIDRARVNLRR
jgi:pyruvate dehydrogenase (quinone)